MIIYKPIPVLFEVAGLKIYSYGVMLALAFLISFLLVRKKAQKGLKKDIDNIFLLSLIGGVIGARIGWFLLNINQSSNLFDIFKIWEGGMVSYSGILGAVLLSFAYIHVKKLNFLEIADLFAPYIALGFAIGRIGCFLRWCCYGKPSMFGLALWVEGIPRHATQLYLVIGNLIIFSILFFIYENLHRDIKKKGKKKSKARQEITGFLKHLKWDGSVFFLFLLMYSILRFFVDFFRVYTPREYIAGMALSQWTSMAIIFASLFYIMIRKK